MNGIKMKSNSFPVSPCQFPFHLAPNGSLFAGYNFVDQFIFRYILEHFFSCKRKLHFVYEHI